MSEPRRLDDLPARFASSRRMYALVLCAVTSISGCFDRHDVPVSDASMDADADEEAGVIDLTPSEPATSSGASSLYPQVVRVGMHCTGTIVGPQAVLTSTACANEPATVSFADDSHAWTRAYPNPYLSAPKHPAWWSALDAGGLDAEAPRMHDTMLLFVPTLTAALLAEHDLEPASLLPTDSRTFDRRDTVLRLVTTAGSSALRRRWTPASFRDALTGQIAVHPRDGFVTLAAATLAFGIVDMQTLGAPVFSSHDWHWAGNVTVEGVRTVAGTLVNATGDSAPSARVTSIAVTLHQEETIRRNRMWARARLDDIDGDGIPAACDSDPSSSTGSTSRCPLPIGLPASSDESAVMGAVECEPGFVPAGLEVHSGADIRSVKVLCRATACVLNGTACSGEYVPNDRFGGNAGTKQTVRCGVGEVITRIEGTSSSAGALAKIAVYCAPFSAVRSGTSAATLVGTVGAIDVPGGSIENRACAPGEYVSSFVARGSNADGVEGLALICEPSSKWSDLAGVQGGSALAYRCPEGYVVRGIEAFQDLWNGVAVLGYLGLRCAPRSRIASPGADADEWTLHSSYQDEATRSYWPSLRRPADRVLPVPTNRSPPSVRRCPPGSTMQGLSARTGVVIQYVENIKCRTASGETDTVPVEIGGTGGTPASISCPESRPYVTGLLVQSGLRVDGLALECSP